MYKVGELFAGIGGIALGFQKAGFDIVWANEIDQNACKTYRVNFKHKLYEQDIKNLNPNILEKVDVLTAGFPCQAFSIAGHRKGFDDKRGQAFFEILKFIDILKPKVLFFENVRYLETHDDGKTFNIIKEELSKTNREYHFTYRILDTSEYSTLPHHRERFYMVCFKDKSLKNIFEETGWPKKVNSSKRIPFEKIVDDYADELHYFNRYPWYYKEAIKKVDDKTSFYQWRRIYCRKNKSGLCPTLTANMGAGGHNVPLVMDKKDLRRLTPEECLRLQGINDKNFLFSRDISMGAKYKQIGNSVSVPVVQLIANKIMEFLKNKGY